MEAGTVDRSLESRALALAFQRGEKGAYQAIHDRYAGRVHAICRKMMVEREESKEAAQEAFLRVYQALGRFNGDYNMEAWISRITKNVCLDLLRARRRRPNSQASVEELEWIPSGHPDATDPAGLSLRAAHRRMIRNQLQALPSHHTAALILRDWHGFSYAEVAERMELSESQVKALLHRARRGFREGWLENSGLRAAEG